MSYEIDVLDVSFKAAKDLSSYQYCFVELSADNTVTSYGTSTSIAIGVLQNKPTAAGQAARVRVLGVSRIIASEAETYGLYIGATTGGKSVSKTANTDIYYGMCIEGNATFAGSEPCTVLLTGLNFISA
jgi:hypothetical protein